MHYFSISRAPCGKSTPTVPTSNSKEAQHGVVPDKIIKSELKDHEVINAESKVENDDKTKNKTEHIDDVKVVGTKPIVISLFGKKSDAAGEKNPSSKAENNDDDFETSENDTFEDQLLGEEENSPWNHVCELCTQVFENDKSLKDHNTICSNKHKTTPKKVQNIAKIEKCESPEIRRKSHVKDSNQSAEEILNVNKQLTTDVNVSSTNNTAELDDDLKDSKLKKLPLNCDVCDFRAFSSQNLIKHKKKNIQNPLPCPKCPFKSCSERGLKNHQKILHGQEEELPPVDVVNKQLTNVKETEMDNGNSAEVIF